MSIVKKHRSSGFARAGLVAAGLAVSLFALGCGSSGGGDGSSEEVATGQVEIGFIQHGTPNSDGSFPDLGGPGESRIFTNDSGQSITLDVARAHVATVTLVPCEEDAAAAREIAVHGGAGVEPQTAVYDHTVDFVAFEDLVAYTAEVTVADVAYCSIEYGYGPGTGAPDALDFQGTCSDETASRDFSIQSPVPFVKSLGIQDRDADNNLVDGQLVPSGTRYVRGEDDDQVQDLLLGTLYNALLNGIDCVNATDAELTAHLVSQLSDGVLPNGVIIAHHHLIGIDSFTAIP